MFVPGDFGPPPQPRMPRERLIGALVLLMCIILCLALVLAMDAARFNPHNATVAATLTAQAKTPTVRPRRTPTPNPGDLGEQALSVFPSSAKLVS